MHPIKSGKRIGRAVVAISCLALFILGLVLWTPPQYAHAGDIHMSENGNKATIAASTCIKYKGSETGCPAWNHGTFYVYFFQETDGKNTTLVKTKGSDIATMQTDVNFSGKMAWAKVHVAAVATSTEANGGKNKRLKYASGKNINYFDWAKVSQRYYVWIEDTGGDAGTISIPGTASGKTIYANGTAYKNVDYLQIHSQPASNRKTDGATESNNKDIINVPFVWTGKDKTQVAMDFDSDKGIGSNENFITYYRMNWNQYTDGTSYAGFSLYKLRHGENDPGVLFTSINLCAVGIYAAPTYKDEKHRYKTGKLYRNYDTSLMCYLKTPRTKVKLDTDGGTLIKGLESYEGDAASFTTAVCDTYVTLPSTGYKLGHDKSKQGYALAGYAWENGSNRETFNTYSCSKAFVPFDQTSPQKPSSTEPTVKACNAWSLPTFGETNISDGVELKTPTASKVTYKAIWEPRSFTIHYFANGAECGTEDVLYDQPYTIKEAPSGSSGWKMTLEDGSTLSKTSGYMPAQDIYCYATTEAASTIRYHINGRLAGTYVVTWDSSYGTADGSGVSNANRNLGCAQGTSGYATQSMRKYNNDGKWDTNAAKLSATYTQYEDTGTSCIHTKTAYYCSKCGSASWSSHTHSEFIGYSCTWCGRVSNYCYHSILECTESHKHEASCYTDYDYATSSVYYDRNYCSPVTGYTHYSGDITNPGNDAYFTATGNNLPINQNAISYTEASGKAMEREALANGGTVHKWFTDPGCTEKAASSYSFTPGSCLDFYAYTTQSVTWTINDKPVKTSTLKYGELVTPHAYDEEINPYGGKLKGWYTDRSYKTPASSSCRVGTTPLVFYGYTEHTVHFWLDTGTRAGGDGTSSTASSEKAYCLHEETIDYGKTLALPSGSGISKTITRSGCEDWAKSCGKWFVDSDYKTPASSTVTITKDCTYYSFNTVKLSYDLTTSAKALDKSEGGSFNLFADTSLSKQATLRGFLPQPALYRYGSTVGIDGDGTVYWKTKEGMKRTARSVKGGFLTREASDNSSKSLTLLQSTTVFKNWAQGLYDGVITH